MEIQANPQPGRDNSRDTIDLDDITSNHAWSRYPMNGLSFRNLVEESTSPRTDMLQFRTIAQVDAQGSKDTFSQISNGVCVFKIPDTIACDRTVTRGSADAYYLDDMDVYLNREPGELKIEDIPLNQRSLGNRSFNAFRKRADYFREHIMRRRLGRWVPSNAYEVRHFSDMQLAMLFPKASARIRDVIQPAGMPLPCPFVVYYYHRELKEIQDLEDFTDLTERQKRLWFCLEFEYYILFLDCWWKEAVHGGRQFVLNIETIDALAFRCADLTTVAGKPVQVILEHMRSAATKPENCHNWMMFAEDEMEESAFVWETHGPNEPMAGEYDANEPSGITLWCNTTNRRISRVRGSSATFRRGKSLLDKTVSVPDLERIRGLMPIIRRNGWDRRGNIKLSHLLENLVNLQSCTSGLLDRATWTGSNRHAEIGANHDRRYICDQRGTPSSQRYNGRSLVVYDGNQDQARCTDDGYSRNRVGNTYHEYDNPYDRGASSSYYQERGGTEQRRYYNEDRRDGYQHNPPDDSFHNDRAREDERDRSDDRHFPRDRVDYDDYEHRDRGGAHNSAVYRDLDDPSGNEYANAHRNDEGERYYRTHNPVTDVQVDVFTEGMRTPAANTSCRHSHEIRAQTPVDDGPRSPAFVPPASNENQPDQAYEKVRMNNSESTRNVLNSSLLTSTPIVLPGPEGLVVVRPGPPVLSRNQHCTPRRSSHISSDVTTGQSSVTPASGSMQHISKLPTGNVPWMLNAPKRRNEEKQKRSDEDNTKRARTDSHPEQVHSGSEIQDVGE